MRATTDGREHGVDRAGDAPAALGLASSGRGELQRRRCGGRSRRIIARASFSQGAHGADELVAAVLVVAEHVEARAGRREEHRVARRARATRATRTASSIVAARRTGTRVADRARDGVRGLADEHRGAALARERVDERRVAAALVAPAGDEHGARLDEPLERGHRRADVGALRVVVEAHAARPRRPAPSGAAARGTSRRTRRMVGGGDAERGARRRWRRPR